MYLQEQKCFLLVSINKIPLTSVFGHSTKNLVKARFFYLLKTPTSAKVRIQNQKIPKKK